MARLIAALDTADLARARDWAAAVAPHAAMLKVGLELFAAYGATALAGLPPGGVFLDLKLHDIPNTVAGAVRAVLAHRPAMLTLHAAGGSAMLDAARTAAEAGAAGARPLLLGVTVLTSLSAEALGATGVAGEVRAQVARLARLAMSAGCDGLVCAPTEVAMLRDAFGAAPILVVPGVRSAGGAAADQARTATPAEAARAGADWVVVGRPIFAAPDPASAAAAIAAELAAS